MVALKDICWVCERDGKITPQTHKKYGIPVCDEHDDVDPESMEQYVINLFARDDVW